MSRTERRGNAFSDKRASLVAQSISSTVPRGLKGLLAGTSTQKSAKAGRGPCAAITA
eukprot:CAMPEP_0185522684 /NCGR_PEP_ID=MMETSP1366-20130426/83336_1 /TAXON_ID=38817 /ORGANISM="Gephyrocapsa oceanica, Strain RCC1303" /LENGTH=56 /DNA_ID=CAMNT_0028133933 /DNA_START=52 /DNA_END=219 /DNA_ORIENTATION=+